MILQANNLRKNFIHNGTSLEILKSITVSFNQGNSYAITGVSGSGKSTLIHILSGTDLPTDGQIYFNTDDINKFNQKQKENFLSKDIGLVFQEPYLIKELTVLENVIIKGLINCSNVSDVRSKGMDFLEQIGLGHKADQLPATLSIGQQQRVAILRALFNKPKFLLADEPTANLDEKTGKDITKLLNQFKNEFSTGIITVTHDKYLADSCEQTLNLENGNLLIV